MSSPDLSRLQLSIKALGLRYAGTGCSSASSTLLYYLNYFKRLRDAGGSTHASELVMSLGRNLGVKRITQAPQAENLPTSRPDKPTIELCLGATAVALGMVMAGTGDLSSLRMLRDLRWRVDEGVTYGAD